MGELHSIVLFSTAVQFNVTELVGRTVTFVNYMERYTWIELAELHLAYGATFTSDRAAQRLYRETYPNLLIPQDTTFSSICCRLWQLGTVHRRRVDDQGWGNFVRTPEAEEAMLQYIENNPSLSTQDIARHFYMSHVTVS